MAVKIRKPDSKRFCKALVFAPGGAGKTVLLGSAALDERTSPCLFIDFEGGSESLAGLDIDVAEVNSWQDYNEIFELLASGDSGYKSTAIDSISETHKFALLDILAREGPNRKDPDLLQQGDYGKATVQLRRLLREFRDLPMHVFFASHAKEVEIPREGRVRIPDMAGQMAEEVAGLMSVCGYLAQFEEEGELHRTLLLHSFPKYRIKARTRWGETAPEELIDPDITILLDALGYGDPSSTVEIPKISSRGKIQEEELPVEDPVDPVDKEAPVEVTPEKITPPEPQVTPEEEDQPPIPYDDMSIKALKAEASERDVEIAGVTTKKGIIDLLRAADLAEQEGELANASA